MKISAFPTGWIERRQQSSWFDTFARRHLFGILSSLEHGYIVVHENGRIHKFGNPDSDLHATATVIHPAFYRMVLLNGSIGAGEAYMSGCWTSPDLTSVIRVICRNMARLEEIDSGLAAGMSWVNRLIHRCNANSLRGSRKNIGAHYDLSNELFREFLDSRMMYSSAIYSSGSDNLETAQENKLREIARKLDVQPSDHVVEIGTGWGGLAVYLAENHGCRVTTTTISREQHDYARDLIARKGLEHRITLLDRDYRQLEGSYDKLVSIEMIEAVGRQYLPEFFRKCNALVNRGGRMVLQAITLPEQRYESSSEGVDFIQKYIFPGGFLPSMEAILRHTGEHTQLQIEGVHDIGLDYARTLEDWRKRFSASRERVSELGFDSLFTRLWEFYFCYCEGGFRERSISTVQATFRKV